MVSQNLLLIIVIATCIASGSALVVCVLAVRLFLMQIKILRAQLREAEDRELREAQRWLRH